MSMSNGAAHSSGNASTLKTRDTVFWFTDILIEKSQSSSVLLKLIEQCTTQIFLISQSTGILAVILYNLDYQFSGLKIIAIIVWLLTIVLAILFSLTYVVKACMFSKTTRQELTSNIVEVCCLASASITFSSVSCYS